MGGDPSSSSEEDPVERRRRVQQDITRILDQRDAGAREMAQRALERQQAMPLEDGGGLQAPPAATPARTRAAARGTGVAPPRGRGRGGRRRPARGRGELSEAQQQRSLRTSLEAAKRKNEQRWAKKR